MRVLRHFNTLIINVLYYLLRITLRILHVKILRVDSEFLISSKKTTRIIIIFKILRIFYRVVTEKEKWRWKIKK